MDRRPPGMPAEPDENPEAARDAAPPVDAAVAERIRKSLANPRPPIPAAEAFARLDARIAEYKAKRGL